MSNRKYNVKEGQRFDLLTIIKEEYLVKKGYKQRYVYCKCDCGNTITLRLTSLFVNKINSCGCIISENMRNRVLKHGMSKTPIFYVFVNMKNRCYYKPHKSFQSYGGRGITICDEWLNDFMVFYNWAISNGYKKGLTIERIDNDKDYSPDNCTFVTRIVQCNNKRTNHIIEYQGENLTMMEFCRKYNLSYGLFESRIRNNKSIEQSMINCGEYKFKDQRKKMIYVEPIN